jgi:hypothetical protein
LEARLHQSYPDWEVEAGRDFVDRNQIVQPYRAGLIPFWPERATP